MDDEITSEVVSGRPEALHVVALIAVVVGGMGSVGSMLVEGHPPIFLRVLFAIWVASPFAALVLADLVSKRWSFITRRTLYGVMLVVTLSSLAIYGYVVLRPHELTTTAPFVIVPPASWLLIVIVVPVAALISRRRSSHRVAS